VALIDDTLIRKRGHRIAGTSWRRDPLGPHFADNFIWASRFLQISLALPEHPEAPVSAARAIPVDLQHAPSPRKPSRRADPAGPEWQSWRAASAASAISRRGAERLTHLRHAIDQFAGGATRPLLVCADATFTNRTVLQDLPPRTTLLGRIRKDARLYALPTAEEETTVAAAAAATASVFPLPNSGVARNPSRGPPCKPLPQETSTTSTSNSSPLCAGRMPVASDNFPCSSSARSPIGCAKASISAIGIRLT